MAPTFRTTSEVIDDDDDDEDDGDGEDRAMKNVGTDGFTLVSVFKENLPICVIFKGVEVQIQIQLQEHV
jgi:hypothetical protein